MIEGLAVGAWTIARPLVFVALLPLATGIALRHVVPSWGCGSNLR